MKEEEEEEKPDIMLSTLMDFFMPSKIIKK